MALLDSPMFKNLVLVPRSSLYFNQWRYVVLFRLPEASFLRVLKHDRIDESIRYRNEWHSRYQRNDIVTAGIRNILHEACDYFLARKHPYKKVVCSNNIWLYTNNLEDFEDLNTITTGRVLYANQAQVVLAPNVVSLKNPRHSFRTYFRERWLTDTELANLRRYFHARGSMFRLSPGFSRLMNGHRMWVMSNYFVDHDEPQADFLINMAIPGIVRKTLPIVARN